MVRTVVSIDPEDKAWLDRRAKEENVPMTELVRRAIRRLRKEYEPPSEDFERLLRETSGIWKAEDGLAYQRHLREEWDDRK